MILDSYSIHGHILCPSSSSDASSSSTRSSHLSVLTSSSSVSDMQVASPLPSPSFSISSSISKTHAFFSAPFAEGSPTPVPPPNPPSRSASLRSDTSSASAEETPKMDHQTPNRSLNADFFGSSTNAVPPIPPPSVRSLTASSAVSPEHSPPSSPPTRLLPTLTSRLFPSRAKYSTIDSLPSRDPSVNTRRGFVDVEDKEPSHTDLEGISTPVVTSSPSALPTPSVAQSSTTTNVGPSIVPRTGDIIKDLTSNLSLELIRTLGQGAFSSVWLAKDVEQQLSVLELTRKSSLLRSRSLTRGRRKRLEGTKPLAIKKKSSGDSSVYYVEDSVEPSKDGHRNGEVGRLVAVKMTDRKMCETNDRSRVSFVREVEVLRHIAHPSIVSYLHSFSTPSHHCLVLEHIGGGELFDLIDSEDSHSKMGEPLLRRIFGELCKAVGWMHGVGLVHRDIKLENILLTAQPFASDGLPPPPHPLVKLTDFGLSRFIDPAQPLLTTRCGSESYAAPELVTGRPYDGRETDAWSCGVVLYALVTRRLPFDKARPREEQKGGRDIPEKGRERRALLVRIAKAEYSWPTPDTPIIQDGSEAHEKGMSLSRREAVRRVVEKLLVRDCKKRSKIIDLWEDEWMKGDGAPVPPPPPPLPTQEILLLPFGEAPFTESPRSDRFDDGPSVELDDDDDDADEEDDDDGEGVLVDGDDIGPEHVARQEH